ncbi:MAG: hypothetical protein Q7U73_15970 [Rubrivivax sp.]|nr:hypothetical protein [Rubrivivax sp.]
MPSLLFSMLLAAQAQAQTPATKRPDPLDPKAQVPAMRYGSSFAQFRRIGDDPPLAWREANDVVTRIGGWRVYTREAHQPDPAAAEKPAAPVQAPASAPALTPSPTPAPTAPPMPAGHSGHKH